jgi:hypothetical protein
MSEPFPRQNEAWAYVKSVKEPKERLMLEVAVARALSFLATDPEYRASFSECPMDLLTYARTVHALLQKDTILKDIIDGKVTSIDDLDPFPSS